MGTIKFDPNKTTLRKSSYSTLNEVVAVVQEFPWLDITVVGHSTASGSGCNRLTEGRAETVIKYLTDKGATNKMKPESKCKTFIGVEIKASGGSAPVPHAAIAECKKEKKVKHEKEVASKKKEKEEKVKEKNTKEKEEKAAKEKASKEAAAKAAEKAKKESDQKAEKAAKEKASKEKAAKAAEKAAKEKASKAEKASKEAAAKKAEKAAKENGYKAEKAKKAAEKADKAKERADKEKEKDAKAKEKADKAKEKADKVAAEKKHKENAAKAVEKKAKEHLQKKQCNRDTGGTCRILGCYKSRGPTDCVSKKWHRLDAKCFCKYGLCAKGGKCYDAITGKFGGSEEEQEEDVVE